ncbi:MAG: 2TM domain-containing protein [Halobacteriota archaeon]
MASDEELMALARKRAQDKVGFYTHFSTYLVVNALLVVVW